MYKQQTVLINQTQYYIHYILYFIVMYTVLKTTRSRVPEINFQELSQYNTVNLHYSHHNYPESFNTTQEVPVAFTSLVHCFLHDKYIIINQVDKKMAFCSSGDTSNMSSNYGLMHNFGNKPIYDFWANKSYLIIKPEELPE